MLMRTHTSGSFRLIQMGKMTGTVLFHGLKAQTVLIAFTGSMESLVSLCKRCVSLNHMQSLILNAGSGKSTLARFIFDRLNVQDHLCPWAESRVVVKVAHFFWNPGTTLQKSWIGMLRSVLFQLLDEVPGLCEPCVSPSRWRTALLPDVTLSEWTESELLDGIRAFIRKSDAHIFFLIDGLDVS